MPTTILVVCSNKGMRDSITEAINQIDDSIEVITACTAKEGEDLAENRNVFDGVIVEARMTKAVTLVSHVRERGDLLPIVVAYEEGDQDALKPFNKTGLYYDGSPQDLAAKNILRLVG